ncbi:type VII secretion effector [Listeria ivanovii subsp. londoniensis]|uniref:DUF3130 domain-containing protein n=2 Tax=Listeria ivanovii TaxID=1638 RepID=A0ABS1G329_LISIV|nr:DUF3130 domain-containing protein [Listeria ivanovii]AIS58873.1 hypothetical protein JL58_02270 [Listeria ivanovii subsp. londoniensis]MBK1961276.1 DUF3130 domain-containing protein [Listeria ivanovii subsp. londoniensis]SDX12847.1 type VII secretion effector, SACOL2603 family [Listeria ivanovii]VEH44848.1 type VII secretion effector [Listeria ivanovii subsp. londoniensis]
MSEIKVKTATFQKHANQLEIASNGNYLPLKNGNMAYSRANSINQLRSALIDLVDVVEDFQQVAKKDAARLEKMGKAYNKQDKNVAKKISQLEVR